MDLPLEEILARIPSLRIAVVGDFFLDKYQVTDPALDETSIETGLTARQVVEVRRSPGAAGTVTNNLSALGVGRIEAVGVIGEDGEGWDLRRGLEATRVHTTHLLPVPGIFTPTYTKPMVRTPGGEVERERLDIKNRTPLPGRAERHVLMALRTLLPSVDAVIVLDQVSERNCGVVMDAVRDALPDLAREHPRVLIFADSRERIGEFRGVTIKPNRHEATRAVGANDHAVTRDQAEAHGRELAARTGRDVYVTCGEAGILVCGAEGVTSVPARPVDGPVDIVGAGDSTTAGIVTALCAGATPAQAAAMGCLCASITIRKLGTTGTASPEELRQALVERGAGVETPR